MLSSSNRGLVLSSIALVVSFVSLVDFTLYLYDYSLVILCFCLSLLLLVFRKSFSLSAEILIYALVISILILANVVAGKHFNGLLVIPIITYAIYKGFLFQDKNLNREVLNIFFKAILLIIIFIVFLELIVKLGMYEIPIMQELIMNVGIRRIDVLRVQSPFGSPLSLASLLFVMFVYFLVYGKSKDGILIFFILLILMLTGSRTSFMLSIIVFMYLSLAKLIIGKSIRICSLVINTIAALLLITIILSIYYLYNNRLTYILSRVLSINSYNIMQDVSFQFRSNTSLRTLDAVMEGLPNTLIFSLPADSYVSDSAFVSLFAGSGILAGAIFSLFVIYRFIMTFRGTGALPVLIPAVIAQAMMVGDAFTPAVSFCILIMSFVLEKKAVEISIRTRHVYAPR